MTIKLQKIAHAIPGVSVLFTGTCQGGEETYALTIEPALTQNQLRAKITFANKTGIVLDTYEGTFAANLSMQTIRDMMRKLPMIED